MWGRKWLMVGVTHWCDCDCTFSLKVKKELTSPLRLHTTQQRDAKLLLKQIAGGMMDG